ncbi:DUF1659 domain-containing protein [Sporosarcina sp. ACRSM]|uniref:DUF1659 domain-containing protein n=1 Tax=Sporosarcina sp. ACRSM TaxID=2918216 RepID=UPI001EF5C9CE|nr:DUF1659 domain-containing protein [Sporosarcina sp. ACRSM]MCG7336552.1 DUF1659 domain-containing protein [Sporosarcina sp. ACRSM]
MATIEFKEAVGRVYFDGGLTEDGKLIRKSKTYRNIVENVEADALYNALQALGQLSELPFIGAEKVETSSVMG